MAVMAAEGSCTPNATAGSTELDDNTVDQTDNLQYHRRTSLTLRRFVASFHTERSDVFKCGTVTNCFIN